MLQESARGHGCVKSPTSLISDDVVGGRSVNWVDAPLQIQHTYTQYMCLLVQDALTVTRAVLTVCGMKRGIHELPRSSPRRTSFRTDATSRKLTKPSPLLYTSHEDVDRKQKRKEF